MSDNTAFDLAFCDLDGTICNYDLEIRPVIVETMSAVIRAGKRITICTGRGYQSLAKFLDRVPVNAPLILCNGSLILEPHSRRVIEFLPVSVPFVHNMMRLAVKEDLYLRLYMDDLETIVEHQPQKQGFVVRTPGGPRAIVADPFDLVSRSPHKLAFVSDDPAETKGIAAVVRSACEGSARVVVSSPSIIEVLTPGVSKASAMARVASIVGVPRERVLAIGDGDNDVEMICWAGKGIAMGNATQSAKEAAEWVAPSVNQDGLAQALEKFMLRRFC
jgi:Cof subfamily protein (haloacid dehalogenase superfamily)